MIQEGVKVRFTKEAKQAFGVDVDRRKVFTVVKLKYTAGFRQADLLLSDGGLWNECWVEVVND